MKDKPVILSYLIPRQKFRKAMQEFWQRADDAREVSDRLLLLQEFAEVLVYPLGYKPYSERRKQRLPQASAPWCWACRISKPEHRHHIIQVQNGGSNKLGNFVPLCRGCHAAVHPWMKRAVS